MLTFIANTWWIWLICISIWFIFFIIISKKKNGISAQFIEPVSFVGCSILLFNSIGLISAILSIIASSLKIFLWMIG